MLKTAIPQPNLSYILPLAKLERSGNFTKPQVPEELGRGNVNPDTYHNTVYLPEIGAYT